jgi:squalene-hopene/tetraprenyl-beta-curcumene cyclase
MKKNIFLQVIIFIIFFIPLSSHGWKNEITHPGITERAIILLTLGDNGNYDEILEYGFYDGVNECSYLTEGSVKEDKTTDSFPGWNEEAWGENTCSIDDFSYLSHGYNPITETGWMIPSSTPSLGYANNIFNTANQEYEYDKAFSYFMVGRFIHLLEDMSSSTHVHADYHGPGGSDDLEGHAENNFDNISFSSTYVRRPATDGLGQRDRNPDITVDSADNFMLNVAWRTYYMTSYFGGELVTEECDPPEAGCDIQPDSELRRMFSSLRYDTGSWYTNDSWIIDEIGNFWIGAGVGMNSEWWECPDDDQYFYIENTGGVEDNGISPMVFKKAPFKRIRSTDNLDNVLSANSESEDIRNIYARNLFSLSSEWAAGLMQYFWGIHQGPIFKGLNWLRNQQLENGSWSNEPAITSLAVLALLNHGYDESDPVVSDGIQYILSRINPDGSVHNVSYRYTYYTSMAISPLAATKNSEYDDEILKMRSWLVNSQWDENSFYGSVPPSHSYYGGFGYGNSTRPDLSNTQWALMGLSAAGIEQDDPVWEKAIIFVERCQNPDGGAGYVPYSYSIHTMTAAAIWSYVLSGLPQSDQRVINAMSWLTNNYSVTSNDGWGSTSDYYYALTFAKALTMSHRTKLGSHDWFSDLSALLIQRQTSGGNWPGGGWLYGQADLQLTTCYSILSLQTRTMPQDINQGIQIYLASHSDLHVYDPKGRHVGINYETMTIEENIPGASFKIIDSGGNEIPYDGQTPAEGETQVLDLPAIIAGSYRIELVGTSDGPFHLTINGEQEGNVVTSKDFEGEISLGERLSTWTTVTAMQGSLTLLYEPLDVLPTLHVSPESIELFAQQDTLQNFTFEVSEIGGQETLHAVTMHCTDIVGSMGVIAGTDILFDVNNFDLPPSGNMVVNGSIFIPSGFIGLE